MLGPRTTELRFARVEYTDRSSHFVAVGEAEIELGDSSPDPHRGGFLLRNSEVGAGAASIVEYLFRQVCTNGLVVPVGTGAPLFYRHHRKTEEVAHDLGTTPAAVRTYRYKIRSRLQTNPALRELLQIAPGW